MMTGGQRSVVAALAAIAGLHVRFADAGASPVHIRPSPLLPG